VGVVTWGLSCGESIKGVDLNRLEARLLVLVSTTADVDPAARLDFVS
jgi:hypothetical protein